MRRVVERTGVSSSMSILTHRPPLPCCFGVCSSWTPPLAYVRLLAKEMVPELSDGLRLTAFIAAPMICSFCVRSTIKVLYKYLVQTCVHEVLSQSSPTYPPIFSVGRRKSKILHLIFSVQGHEFFLQVEVQNFD